MTVFHHTKSNTEVEGIVKSTSYQKFPYLAPVAGLSVLRRSDEDLLPQTSEEYDHFEPEEAEKQDPSIIGEIDQEEEEDQDVYVQFLKEECKVREREHKRSLEQRESERNHSSNSAGKEIPRASSRRKLIPERKPIERRSSSSSRRSSRQAPGERKVERRHSPKSFKSSRSSTSHKSRKSKNTREPRTIKEEEPVPSQPELIRATTEPCVTPVLSQPPLIRSVTEPGNSAQEDPDQAQSQDRPTEDVALTAALSASAAAASAAGAALATLAALQTSKQDPSLVAAMNALASAANSAATAANCIATTMAAAAPQSCSATEA